MEQTVVASGRFLTLSDVANELKVSIYQVRRLLRQGRLGFIKISTYQRRVPREALEAFINKELQ